MPNLDFDTTRPFRDFMLGRTLQQPNGPQTWNSTNYVVQNLTDYPNIDPGDVETNRTQDLTQIQNSNTFKPTQYFITDMLDTYPRRANLNLYPYFTKNDHTLVSIMSTTNYDTESELFKFAAHYIKEERNGPVHARIEQNIYAATVGRVRLIDALNGNTATAINILTGREPLIESNNKITVAKTIAGKAIDFLQTASGIEFPFTEIPGDYLSDPANPINYRPQPSTQSGKILQDITGAIGSLVGIQRRPKMERKPSDLFIEYMGDGQKKELYNLLTFSKYAPNYTTTARSQNSSKVFNFVDRAAQGVKEFLGIEAPAGVAYIGDDRGDDVRYAMNDFYDRPVRSNYYLSLMFDNVQTELFQKSKNIGSGGQISGNLTWISKNSKNKLGEKNIEYNSQRSNFEDSLSTKFGFREDSILGITQDILDTMPSNGGESRSHISNVIDQTSRVFREGDVRMSRGSAIKYIDKTTGDESGVEYCRVWTKDRPYFSMSDTMKKTGNIRKFDDSVLGGTSKVWNINYAPMSDGNKGFQSSSNIVDNYQYGGGYYAKKYMFSIENLAWKTSTSEGFTVQDLPHCERGPNGGRVMWFPPYDLKVSEQNNAKWEENNFLGRPEPIYTYQHTSRSGQISFKVVVDHPSVINLLVREHFKNMSDDESENYINAVFAGCKDLDLYDLVKTHTTIDSDDAELILRYLNDGVGPEIITKYKIATEGIKELKPISSSTTSSSVGTTATKEINIDVSLNFANNDPSSGGIKIFTSSLPYSSYYNLINSDFRISSLSQLSDDTQMLIDKYVADANKFTYKNDLTSLKNNPTPILTNPGEITQYINDVQDDMTTKYNKLDSDYNTYVTGLNQLKIEISEGRIETVTFDISSTSSPVADNAHNIALSYRRTYSVIIDILNKLNKNGDITDDIKNKLKWSGFEASNQQGETTEPRVITYKDLGHDKEGKIIFKTTSYGEEYSSDDIPCFGSQFVSVPGLNITSPISFACRRTKVKMTTKKSEKQPTESNTNLKTSLVEDGTATISSKFKKPPIDVMKRITMKTLSECYYFKKLEEDSPVAFTSLREKLRYFHPAFHSTTPEGLNARLTFINQCVRPGDTLPIKRLSDPNDLNARNTTFGPPPVCVLRVGDFYNSKIIIRDVNITFDDTTWDLNPEGIGVQPMIANVNLQINFIGGHGLAKPVERLQNALSSNFYANTEMYDERSISTNKTIDGIDAEQYTTEFLEKIQHNPRTPPEKSPDVNDKIEIAYGEFIGKLNGNEISYTELINDVFTKTTNYFDTYMKAYNDSVVKYGSKITSLFFSENYRRTFGYDVYQGAGGTPTSTISLLGEYDKSKELNILYRGLKTYLIYNIEKNISSLTRDMFDIKMTDGKRPISDKLLKPFVSSFIQKEMDGLVKYSPIIELEKSRNELISALDKVNYLIYYLNDGMVTKKAYTKATLNGYTSDLIYDKYSKCIDFINSNHSKLTSHINNDVNFNVPSQLTNEQTIEMVSILMKDQKNNILSLYAGNSVFKDDVEKLTISKALDKFFVTPKIVSFKLKKYPEIKDNNETKFTILSQSEITDTNEKTVLINIKSSMVGLIGNKLNYYKPKI